MHSIDATVQDKMIRFTKMFREFIFSY